MILSALMANRGKRILAYFGPACHRFFAVGPGAPVEMATGSGWRAGGGETAVNAKAPRSKDAARERAETGKAESRNVGSDLILGAIVGIARKPKGFWWMNCHAKRLECVQLAGAVVRRWWSESGSKLHALQTLRAVRLRLCILAPLRWFNCGFKDDAPRDGIPAPNLPGGAAGLYTSQRLDCGA